MNTARAEENSMIELSSKRYGKFQIKKEQLYHFNKGLIGMGEFKDFALLPLEDSPFFILHHISEDVSFILLPAEKVVSDYEFVIDDETIRLLNAEKPEDIVIFLITNITEDAVYINLKAPVLITPQHHSGCQFVITDRDYPVRHQIVSKEKR